MKDFITEVRLTKVFGYQSIRLTLKKGLNIIYGKNGTGKTTLLHFIVNLLEVDLRRFLEIKFQTASLKTNEGNKIILIQKRLDETRDVVIKVLLNGTNIGVISTNSLDLHTLLKMEEEVRKVFKEAPLYLPAYRSVIEGAYTSIRKRSSLDWDGTEFANIEMREWEKIRAITGSKMVSGYQRDKAKMVAYKTMLCRSWFGQFIPIVRYPGLDEISMQIRQELNSAMSIIAETDQKNISNVFIKVLETILSNNKEIILDDTSELIKEFKIQLDDIQSNEHSYDIYQQLNTLLNNDNLILRDSNSEILIKGILKIYNIALLERKKIKEKAYTIIENFTKSLNENFLENKSIEYNPLMTQPGSGVYIRLYDEKKSKTNFSILSSGERHILSLIFCATHMSNLDGILIIDEPELSLHVDWQRIILTEIIKQTGDRQIIVCTHSPEIAADHDDCFISIISEENIDDMILANDDFELMDLTPSLFNAIESEDLQNE